MADSVDKNGRKRPRLAGGQITAGGIAVGLGLGLLIWRGLRRKAASGVARPRPVPATPGPAQASDEAGVTQAVRFSMLYLLPPIWLASSLADWACHRYSRIEETAGVKESLIHFVMLGEMGLPVLAAAFLEITSPIFLLMISAFLVHEATVYCDLRLATSKREVTPTEQMVHSVMEMMPLVGMWLVTLLHEEELRALFGSARRSPDFSVRLKEQPLSVTYRVGLITALTLFGGVPYVEELWRTARVAAADNRSRISFQRSC